MPGNDRLEWRFISDYHRCKIPYVGLQDVFKHRNFPLKEPDTLDSVNDQGKKTFSSQDLKELLLH